jgi:hypothetical protein
MDHIFFANSYFFRANHQSAEEALKQLMNTFPPPHGLHTRLVKANRDIRTSLGALQRAEKHVTQLEEQLQIQDRWDKDSPDYQAAEEEMAHRRYRLALDELERLVVQRLFELSKLNMTGTGMSKFYAETYDLNFNSRLQASNTNRKGSPYSIRCYP